MDRSLPGLTGLSFGTIYCIGRNYVAHAEELNNEIPTEPLVFIKPLSAVRLDGDDIPLPERSKRVHHEVELVLAIGKGGKDIPEEQALDHVEGYAVGLDLTARDVQQQAKENGHPWSVAKGFDGFAPLSSFIAAREIPNPQDLELEVRVNGSVRQADNTKLMIFPVKTLISYLSGIFTLHPGDLIFTGTPKGVSEISPGDRITATLNKNLARLSVTAR